MAFRCFFRLLFGGSLPAGAVEFLPADARPALPEAPAPKDAAKEFSAKPAEDAQEVRPAKGPEPARPQKTERKPAPDLAEHHRDGALVVLALLQREGRLIDFLRESLDDYDDSDIGASVRDIHRGCKKVLDEHFALEAVMPGDEDESVTVPRGFDPGEVRLIGDVSGEPPFKGVLRHHGWRVTEARLPALTAGVDRHVLAPAEVEIS